jgi:ankyrin repeat protein
MGRRLVVWLALGAAVAGCVGAWIAHRRAEDRRRVEVNRQGEASTDTFDLAIMRNDPRALDRLISEGRMRPGSLGALLNWVASRNESASVEVLLKHGCDPNGEHPYGTPLATAAAKGNRAMVELLLRYRADPNMKSAGFNSPLHCAVYYNQVHIARSLIEAGAKIDSRELVYGPSRPKLRRAADKPNRGNQHTIGGLSVMRKPLPRKNVSPIMLAAWLDEPEMVRMLLKYHPNVALKTNEGETALELARREDNHEIVKTLERVARP